MRESLEIQLGYFGCPPDRARVDELLAALSLTSKAESATRALSGGMKRRLLIAKALVHRPKLVFLDEPTAGVDVELRRDLWAYVRKLRAEGTTVVLTTHYLEEAEALADRVGIINDGKLLLVEEKHSLMKRLGERHLEVRFERPVTQLPVDVGTLSPDGLRFTYVELPQALGAAAVLAASVRREPPRGRRQHPGGEARRRVAARLERGLTMNLIGARMLLKKEVRLLGSCACPGRPFFSRSSAPRCTSWCSASRWAAAKRCSRACRTCTLAYFSCRFG